MNRLLEPLREQDLHDQLRAAPTEWHSLVAAWLESAAGCRLISHLQARIAAGASIYPTSLLRSLLLTPLSQVRVVILGQDPYHGPGQAQGLAFSVASHVRLPPSLRNILAELKRDLGLARLNPDLSSWATQGVLLLNSVLSVEQGRPASHAGCGWESLTQTIVAAVAERGQPCVYLLWGAHAQRNEPLILERSSVCKLGPAPLVLKANHPSPLSARRPPVPFLGCGHFSQTELYLRQHQQSAIVWV
jgi:uracil-DNA glycosylase